MTMDLILRGSTKAAILSLLASRNLVDADGNPSPGIQFCWWAGDGNLMTARGTTDAQGNVLTAPTYLTGQVMILRITTDDDEIAEGEEQWQRSRIAKYIKTNGTLGTMSGIPFYELSNVRLFRFSDVQAKITELDVPGHEWAGGNVG